MGRTKATIAMSLREADRIKTVQAVLDRMLRPGQAALKLGLTVGHVQRLVTRYQEAAVR